MEVWVIVPLGGCTIAAALCLLAFMFDALTNGISGETMEAFANEYTIYFALAFAFSSIAIALLIYSKSTQKNKKTFKVRFAYVTGTFCLFFFLSSLYIWVISCIWNLFEFLGMGIVVFLFGFPLSAVIYLLIGAALLIPFAFSFYCFFISDNKKTTSIVAPIASIFSSAIYCYVMYIFNFFSFLSTSFSSLF